MTSTSSTMPNTVSKGSFFRSVQFALFIAGLVTFTAPGMFDAMGNLGAGGAAEPYAVSAANALVYGLMVIFCISGGGLINALGIKWAMVLGTIGYPLYGAGLYTNSYSSLSWFLIFGSAFCGISAGFFWAAEATVYIAYPPPGEKAKYLAQWAFWKNIAPAIGGAVNLGVNANRATAGVISQATYIVFIVIMCLGFPISMLLPAPQNVWRHDGSRIVVAKGNKKVFQEIWEVVKLLKDRKILCLLPAFIFSYFYHSYQSNFLSLYFTVRARAFSSFLSPFGGIASSYIMGYYLDKGKGSARFRGCVVLAVILAAQIGVWTWTTIVQNDFNQSKPTLDWTSPGFGRAYGLIFFYTFIGQATQNYMYWVISHFTASMNGLSRYAGLFRSMEALGQTIAWAIASSSSASTWVLVGLNFGGITLSLLLAFTVVSKLEDEHPDPPAIVDASDEESDDSHKEQTKDIASSVAL
ncbi:MFS general substrate transporter [Cylindrobasidium torrendii FP15055 ss-10]|uniref:MFS general substrate transporter n=1 Tax=Cylindrobasidium torrendii FP15055 ss-10 TaxID=1314674 RepID=A0A0D7BK14_9AGAR|nr:MFS general substrate transporter [Cylindrobasidium torrendii FP15055 ss-10]